jgi:flagellar motor switch protein FliN/FliY
MIKEFLDLLTEDIVSTIEGLIGIAPDVSIKNSTEGVGEIPTPISDIVVEVSGDSEGTITFLIPPQSATALGDLMLAGDGDEKETMDEEDLDAIKEIVSNIMGALSTALTSQDTIPKLNFSVKSADFKTEIDSNWSANSYRIDIDFEINGKNYDWIILLDNSVYSKLSSNIGDNPSQTDNSSSTSTENKNQNLVEIDNEELKNLKLLLDVKLNLRVRIGSKKMLLKDVLNMDIGSIVELNQLANEPLEVLIDDKKIAEGEVVIVDGNFGIQITSIGSKKERMNVLNG